jgi:hypothetical protein
MATSLRRAVPRRRVKPTRRPADVRDNRSVASLPRRLRDIRSPTGSTATRLAVSPQHARALCDMPSSLEANATSRTQALPEPTNATIAPEPHPAWRHPFCSPAVATTRIVTFRARPRATGPPYRGASGSILARATGRPKRSEARPKRHTISAIRPSWPATQTILAIATIPSSTHPARLVRQRRPYTLRRANPPLDRRALRDWPTRARSSVPVATSGPFFMPTGRDFPRAVKQERISCRRDKSTRHERSVRASVATSPAMSRARSRPATFPRDNRLPNEHRRARLPCSSSCSCISLRRPEPRPRPTAATTRTLATVRDKRPRPKRPFLPSRQPRRSRGPPDGSARDCPSRADPSPRDTSAWPASSVARATTVPTRSVVYSTRLPISLLAPSCGAPRDKPTCATRSQATATCQPAARSGRCDMPSNPNRCDLYPSRLPLR